MKILHLLSQTELTGAEFFAASLANEQIRQGHDVMIVSDRFYPETKAKVFFHPLANRKWVQRFKNVKNLKKLINDEQIEVVHAHSRGASWVAYHALKKTKIPFVSSIHGRQHIHFSSRHFDIYGDLKLPVCKNLKIHLKDDLQLNPGRVRVIQNGFEWSKETLNSKPKNEISDSPLLSMIGRMTGPKGDRVCDFLEYVFPRLLLNNPKIKIQLVGGDLEKLPLRGQEAFKDLQEKFPSQIKCIGFSNDVQSVMLESDLIIGSGRVAIRALSLGKQVYAVGESTTEGWMTDFSWERSVESNFGDSSTSPTKFYANWEKVILEIQEGLHNPPQNNSIIEKTKKLYDIKNITLKVMRAYESARMLRHHPKHIPVLMYHKIPLKPLQTKHKIYVLKDQFEEHLKFFQKKGFQTLTFKEYHEFSKGLKPLRLFPKKPLFLTFDDGYLDNFENALPLLKKYKFKATLFALANPDLRSNTWDTDRDPSEETAPLMTYEQLKEWCKAGMECGAHGINHKRMTEMLPEEIERELVESKKYIETLSNEPCLAFAYPFGSLDHIVKTVCENQDFEFSVATDSGGLHLEEDRHQIFRVNIFPNDTAKQLVKKTSSYYRKYYKMRRNK